MALKLPKRSRQSSVAEALEAEQRAAVSAAVLEAVDAAALGAHHHHRHVAHEGGLVVAGHRDLALEGQIVPGPPQVEARALAGIDLRVPVELVGHSGQPRIGPDRVRRR
jgi:hypothetical protein